MADRRKDMSSLLGDILNDGKPQIGEPERTEEIPQETIDRLGITPEMEQALVKERSKKGGRPRSDFRRSSEYGTGVGETRATFIVKIETLRKIKYIALADTKLLKNIVEECLSKYVQDWESSNGEIQLPKKGGKR